jgi:hypothetical protein
MTADHRLTSLATRFRHIALVIHNFVVAKPTEISKRLLQCGVIFTGSVWAIRRATLSDLLDIPALQLRQLSNTLQWQSIEPSPGTYGPYTEVFLRMPTMVARSFQFIPAETFQSSPFTFIPKQELEDQSEAQTSDQEEISMRFPDSVENFEPVRKSTPISPPPSKTTALLRMKMKFMRARHQLHCAGQERTNEPNRPHGYRHFRLPMPSWMTSGDITVLLDECWSVRHSRT